MGNSSGDIPAELDRLKKLTTILARRVFQFTFGLSPHSYNGRVFPNLSYGLTGHMCPNQGGSKSFPHALAGALLKSLENVIRDAVTYTKHARRKMVRVMDVIYALKRQRRTLYGFGG
ncbi:hypothetical protein RJ639_009385 [Escallonia herrerae]|uniref:Histone H4 n=1 Tax=Escallonia herrerae TaxID=1293975 RepID=A0AA88VUX1_9ASTE|nr:hypothetical protein RJ639_009385 [Escallonia herrerae]